MFLKANLVSYGVSSPTFSFSLDAHAPCSSAKDGLTGASVAIKKITRPFSTSVLSKRAYRELKLLKHIQHENVGMLSLLHFCRFQTLSRSSASVTFSSLLWRICGSFASRPLRLHLLHFPFLVHHLGSYLVTDLLGTNLQRLLYSRPLEKQFIQYFLYQIMVQLFFFGFCLFLSLPFSVGSNTYIPLASSTANLYAPELALSCFSLIISVRS
jgi:hypothetical protein